MRYLTVPSGVEYGPADLEIIRQMGQVGFVRWSDSPFTLNSGISSHVYVFGREDLTDHPDLEWLIGEKLAWTVYNYVDVDEARQQCLIGVPVWPAGPWRRRHPWPVWKS